MVASELFERQPDILLLWQQGDLDERSEASSLGEVGGGAPTPALHLQSVVRLLSVLLSSIFVSDREGRESDRNTTEEEGGGGKDKAGKVAPGEVVGLSASQ